MKLPNKALSHVATYLGKTTRALFAAALTAPSSSWDHCDWTKVTLSFASQLVMAGPYYSSFTRKEYREEWDYLDFEDLCESLRNKLSDGDICGVLVCIDAKSNLKMCWLKHCINVKGRGLFPLSGSVVLEMIDLSECKREIDVVLCCTYGSSSDGMMPSFSESQVLPILHSILNEEGSSLKYLRLPRPLRVASSMLSVVVKNVTGKFIPVCEEGPSEELSQFLSMYSRVMNNRMIGCSTCNATCFGTIHNPWISYQGNDRYIAQNFTCHKCMKNFCLDCDEEKLMFCPCCKVKYCNQCQTVETCTKCHITACDHCKKLRMCNYCGETACEDCSFYCYCCNRTLCSNECFTRISGQVKPRQRLWIICQNKTCHKSSCLDCIKSCTGDIKHCSLCDGIFCSACKPMEYCTCVNGDVCFQCHNKNHDIIECYWQQLPSNLRQLVSNYDEIELTKDHLCQIFQECKQFIGTDKEFDQDSYKETIGAHRASYILAVDFISKDKDKAAVYMIVYGSLMREILECGPDHLMKTLNTSKLLEGSHLFDTTVSCTTTAASIFKFIKHEHTCIERNYSGETRLKGMLSNVEAPECIVHHIKPAIEQIYRDTIFMHTYNEDSGRTDSMDVYPDTTFGWRLRVHTVRCNCLPHLQSPKITPSTKYFRIIHKDKTIFLSSAGRKTLRELGIGQYDEIRVGGVESGGDNRCRTTSTKSEKTNRKSKKSKKRHGPKTKKRGKKQASALPVLTEEETEMKHREAHSRQLTRVLEELKPLLKQIRTDLNNRTLHKPAPKVRAIRSRTSQVETEPATIPTSDSLCGKAGKVAYPILVGEVSNLYKTSKASRNSSKSSRGKNPIATLDLHGLSHYEALKKLDESLPVWVANAMKGESPWVIPVDIICGGGSQVLSEVVKEWIRNNSQVANRPKNYS